MSDRVTSVGELRGYNQAAPDVSAQSRWLYRILPLILFLVVVGAAVIKYRAIFVGGDTTGYIPMLFAVVLSIFLSLLPAMICVVQNTTKQRQLNRLTGLGRFPVSQTTYYQVALTAVNKDRMGAVDADFGAPLFVYFFIVLTGFTACLLGDDFPSIAEFPSFILGGLRTPSGANFAAYQAGTFCIMTMAFVAAYVYSLGRLLDRVNNNDLYPISLYYYAVRAVMACAAAAVMRHTADLFGLDNTSVLLLVAFGIGFAPDLFILAMSRRAFQAMKVWGSRGDPPSATHPTTLSLLMIDDLSRDKIDRLNELGIDNAQVLSRQNPFLLLPRLPYDLGLIVDWIGQAQLYVLVKDEKLKALHAMYIRDVFDLHTWLQCQTARSKICTVLGIDDGQASALQQQLDQDPSFARLQEVRTQLLPQPIA